MRPQIYIPSVKALCLVRIVTTKLKERYKTHKEFTSDVKSLYSKHPYLFTLQGIGDKSSDNAIYRYNKFYKELDAKITENNGAFGNIFTSDF